MVVRFTVEVVNVFSFFMAEPRGGGGLFVNLSLSNSELHGHWSFDNKI